MELMKIAPCCNCCQPFSINGSTFPLKGRLPYTFKCGHAVCEKCILTPLRGSTPIKCQGCQKDANFTDEELKQLKENFESLTKIVPINFCILGSLFYNYCLGLRPVPQSHSNAIYCPAGASMNFSGSKSALFLHNNSKQRPNKNKISPLEREKQLVTLSYCEEHPDKNLELYCEDCGRAMCHVCLVKLNCGKNGHNFMLAQEKNEKFENYIIEHKQTVRHIALRLKKTARDVEKKQSVLSIGTVDVKSTEIIVHEQFSRMHGLLHRHENEVIMELKASENYFNNMISGLNNKALDLIDLVETADIALKPQYKERVSLAGIAKALEKATATPWFLDDSKPTYIKVKVNEEIFKQLEKACELEVENNNLVLLSTSQLPTYMDIPPVPEDVFSETSSIKSIGSVHSTGSNILSHKSDLKKGSDPDFELRPRKDIGPRQNERSQKSCGSVAKAPFVSVTSKLPDGTIRPLTEGMTERVYVTHINSPHEFYVQRLCVYSKLIEMSESYHQKRDSLVTPEAEDIVPGKVFIIYDSSKKKWHRVKIISQQPKTEQEEDVYSVKLIDFGNIEDILKRRLRVVPEEPFFPIFSLQCTLDNCKPRKDKWANEDTILMCNIISRSASKCSMKIVRMADGVLEVELVTYPYNIEESPTCVNEALIYLEHACYGNPKNEVNRMNNPVNNVKSFTKQKLGDLEEVVVTHVVSPDKFYVRKKYLSQYFQQLCDDLMSYYSSRNDIGIIYTPQEGMCVACSMNNKWWRARIIKLLEKSHVEVIFVDVGESYSVSWNNLRKLNQKFYKSDELAVCCKLGGIASIEKKWSAEAIKYMQNELKKEETFQLKVITTRKKRGHAAEIAMLFKLSEQGFGECFNKNLIDKGYAIIYSPNAQDKRQNGIDFATPTAILKKHTQPKNEISSSSQTDNRMGLLKLEVKILSAKSPAEMYVSIKSHEEELEDLSKDMQQSYTDSKCDESIVWKQGEKCAVFSLSDKKWYRAIIEELDPDTQKVKVFLKDLGKYEMVECANLRLLEPKFLNVPDGTFKCHLSGIMSASGEKWPMLTCESLQDMIKEYDRHYITRDGEISNKSLSVELWVFHTIPGGALTPTVKEWRKINDRLVEEGLAIPSRILKNISKECHENINTSIEQIDEGNDLSSTNILELCDNFIAPVTFDDWIPANPPSDKEFIAMSTYVDDNLNIYLYDIEKNTSILEFLSSSLTLHFQNSKPKPYDMFWYPGQICITKFELDNIYYRGKVLKILENNRALVQFVDYGNTQECPISILRKDIVSHNIPVQSLKCKLLGIKPVEGDTWSQKVGDFVHQSVVEKKCLVNVLGDAVDGVIPISLKINMQFDLVDILISFKYALPEDITKKAFEEPADTVDDPNVILDEESQLEDMPSFPEKLDWSKIVEDGIEEI